MVGPLPSSAGAGGRPPDLATMEGADVTSPAPIVEMRGISITFPGVKALDAVDFRLLPGEVHALMGENGAGKSTLIKALTGVYAIDAGEIVIDGEQRRLHGTADAQTAGISVVYQEVNLCTNLTIGENVMLGHEVRGPVRHQLEGDPPRRRAGARQARPRTTSTPGCRCRRSRWRCSSSSRSAGRWSPTRRC